MKTKLKTLAIVYSAIFAAWAIIWVLMGLFT